MTSSEEALKLILKNKNLSLTKQRTIVFNLLMNHGPISMTDLVSGLKTKIDRATAYRIIALFEELGIVQRLHMGWKYQLELSDMFSDHHHHLSCRECGQIIAKNEQDLEQIIVSFAQKHQFHAENHQIEIQGLCDACYQSQSRAASIL